METIPNSMYNDEELNVIYCHHYAKVYKEYPLANPKVTRDTLLAQIDLLQKIQRRF